MPSELPYYIKLVPRGVDPSAPPPPPGAVNAPPPPPSRPGGAGTLARANGLSPRPALIEPLLVTDGKHRFGAGTPTDALLLWSLSAEQALQWAKALRAATRGP